MIGWLLSAAFLQMGATVPLVIELRKRRWLICRTEGNIAWASTTLSFVALLVIDATPPFTWYFVSADALCTAIMGNAVRVLWRYRRRHRDHDEDCKYGPRRRRGGASARLRPWRKVALRPVFAPT